jgi:hypothetical protein
MIEAPNSPAQQTDPPPSTNRTPQWFYLLYAFLALISGNETTISSTPLRILYLAALAAPLIILSTTALLRKYFSAPLPQRWPKSTPILHLLNSFIPAIMISGLLCFAFSIGLRHSVGRHDPRYTIPHDAFWFLMAWMYVLTTYTAERRPLQPPSAR